jgi:hypothetical protein
MRANIFFIIFSLLGISCKPFPISSSKTLISINKNNSYKLNGFYSNAQPEYYEIDKGKYGDVLLLWKQLSYLNKNEPLIQGGRVKLTIEGNKLIALLYNHNTVIDKKVIKIKFKNESLYSRRQFKGYGIPFIYLKYSETQFQLGIDNEGNLIVNRFLGKCGMIFILHACPVENFHYLYKRN